MVILACGLATTGEKSADFSARRYHGDPVGSVEPDHPPTRAEPSDVSPAPRSDPSTHGALVRSSTSVETGSVPRVAERVLDRYASGPWDLVASEYLGLDAGMWGAVFRAQDSQEVVLAIVRNDARESGSGRTTEVKVDGRTQADAIGLGTRSE